MKPFTFIFASFLLLTISSCSHDSQFPSEDEAGERKTILGFAIDNSKTVEQHPSFGCSNLSFAYDQVALNGGGKIVIYYIQSNSSKQGGAWLDVPFLLQEPEIGTRSQKKRTKRKNSEMFSIHASNRDSLLNSFCGDLKLERTELYTDLEGGLELLSLALNSPIYSNWHKGAVIVSDCIHNVQRISGYQDSMDKVRFYDVPLIPVHTAEVNILKFIESDLQSNPTTVPNVNDAIEIVLSR